MYACNIGSRTSVSDVRSRTSLRSPCIHNPASLLLLAGRSAGLRSATGAGGPALAQAVSIAGTSARVRAPRTRRTSERNIAEQPLQHGQRVVRGLEAAAAFLVEPEHVTGAEVHQRRNANQPIAAQRRGRGKPAARHAALDDLDEQPVRRIAAVAAQD